MLTSLLPDQITKARSGSSPLAGSLVTRLRRWILPTGSLGSSGRNSIRGNLYAAISALA